MTNEEFQKIVLEELKGIKTDINGLKEEQGNINKTINEFREEQGNINKTIIAIHEQTVDLIEFRQETRDNFKTIQDYIHDVDVKNSDRHFDFTNQIEELKDSINRIEINTAENWRDIARLKSVR